MIPLVFLVVLSTQVGATFNNVQIDGCTNASYIQAEGLSYGMTIENTCLPPEPTNVVKSVEVDWVDPVNLTLGPIRSGDVETGDNWFYVDSAIRPDLDQPAVLKFINHGFVTSPDVLRNGFPCTNCTVEFDPKVVEVTVPGFSNYSLTGAQDFTVYSDEQPELKTKTYQTVDLGNLYRNQTDFACVVQIFGKNPLNQWVLVQTNPERQVQARMFGSPDANQPESLGYFPVKNGLANTYFRGDKLFGYMEFQMVIQCASPTQLLVYEEPISTRYSPAGRALTSRGVWFTDGANAAYVIFYAVGGLIVLWVLVLVFRRTFRRY